MWQPRKLNAQDLFQLHAAGQPKPGLVSWMTSRFSRSRSHASLPPFVRQTSWMPAQSPVGGVAHDAGGRASAGIAPVQAQSGAQAAYYAQDARPPQANFYASNAGAYHGCALCAPLSSPYGAQMLWGFGSSPAAPLHVPGGYGYGLQF